MALDFDDRADLVERLADTLEPSTDAEYVTAWEAELRQRIEEHERGESKGIPWEQARKQIFGADAEDETSSALTGNTGPARASRGDQRIPTLPATEPKGRSALRV